MEKECQVDVSSVLNDSANPGCATVESFNMKTVVDISESETEDEVLGDGDGYESVTNLRTKRKHDVFKHLLTVRRSPRIAKNKDYSRFNNTVDNPICLDSPDMSDVLASGAKKESSSKLKIELEKKNDQHVRVTISDQKRKDDESAIVTSKAEKGESSSKRDSDTGKCKESDAGNTKSNQNHKIEEKRAKNGETPCKRKALMEQTKSKKNPKIFVPEWNSESMFFERDNTWQGSEKVEMALYARIMLKSEYVKSGHQHAIGWVDDTMLSNLETVLATELFARNLAIGEPLNIPRDVEKNKKIRKVKASKKKPVKGAVVEMIEVSNVNEVKSGVVDKGYDECEQEGVESDLNLGNTDVVDRGKGEYMGNVGNEDTCGKCINDSLNGNEDKGLENLVVTKESSMGLAGKVNEGSVDECIHVADNTEMGSGDRDINLCDAVSLVNVEAKHLEDGKTESAKEFVNEEEHLSVLS
ncbi:hypothetical protein SSX86_003296 [Deinandra increscens subsp. villosa]|uniref:Uncharacterized protein n=1 Tax=Deinandra increscens subsp. villosa TaxID=3103831 RepID=A0AAP0DLI5_9ASTR